MNEDNRELVEYLDKKFNKVDERFEYLDKKINKVDERFNVLSEVFVTKEEMREMVSILSTKEDFNELLTSVDAYAHKADAYFQEMVMLSHQNKRHEKWIHQIAEKLGIKLEY